MIRNKRYMLAEELPCKYPQLQRLPFLCSDIELPDVYEDAGHALVYLLYSGNYKKIRSLPSIDTCGIVGKDRRSILVYHASRGYGLPVPNSLPNVTLSTSVKKCLRMTYLA